GGTARARADDGPRHGRDAARGRRLSGGARRRRGRRAADPHGRRRRTGFPAGRRRLSRRRFQPSGPRRRVTATGARLLLRDLAQLATPEGTDAPLRGPALAEVEVLEDAFVLCA